MASQLIDLTSKKFGFLTVIERVGSNQRKQPTWLVLCSCGQYQVAEGKIS